MKLKERLTRLVDKFGLERIRNLLDEIESQQKPSFGINIRERIDDAADNWAYEQIPTQPMLIDTSKKKRPNKNYEITKIHHSQMYRICYNIKDARQSLSLDGQQRGRVSSALGRLHDAGADLSKLSHFEDWWKTYWRSRDRDGNYSPPRPDQVAEYWWVAMEKIDKRTKPEAPSQESTQVIVVDFEERMRQRAKERK
jgi:hypothetical protein